MFDNPYEAPYSKEENWWRACIGQSDNIYINLECVHWDAEFVARCRCCHRVINRSMNTDFPRTLEMPDWIKTSIKSLAILLSYDFFSENLSLELEQLCEKISGDEEITQKLRDLWESFK